VSILIITPTEFRVLPLLQILAIGGRGSSGVRLEGLSGEGDYGVATLSPGGDIMVHVLVGDQRGPCQLQRQPLRIQDLTLVALSEEALGVGGGPKTSSQGPGLPLESIHQMLAAFGGSEELAGPLASGLEILAKAMGFDRGLVLLKNKFEQIEPVATIGVRANDPWLSESLIQETIKSQRPVSVQNLLGSRYQSQKSLLATGFLSVYTWPLMDRGQLLGVVLLGSLRPHSGLSEVQVREAACLVQLLALLLRYLQRDIKIREEVEAVRQLGRTKSSPFQTVDSRMLDAVQLGTQIAPTELSVLIQGETGVGKEVMASWIHSQSDRRTRPFVAVNCGAIPSELLESVLFGHRKGAFTGATHDVLGKFQQASGGTLFLDEIGDLPAALQVKILRVLQDRVVEPLGGGRSVQADVRIIAATHKDLPTAVRSGAFREDLYYRLAEVTIFIPALRDRPGDLGLLALDFLAAEAPQKRFSEDAWDRLHSQVWRGNVRELRSAVRRAAALSPEGEIRREDFARGLPAVTAVRSEAGEVSDWLGGRTLDEARERFTIEKVRQALRRTGGKRAPAAELLGVTPRTLFRYLEEFQDQLRDVLEKDLTRLSHGSDRGVSQQSGMPR
jgi:DNA-binding NtrC family response regulator